ncbi:MAG: hypothetical protein H7A35_12330 [Planctomycetales bacterium]|nr:hypothetical protein [bacterium]UNM07641.1 MAG: hypothetical protein H7A35_12330 [Planctomycetales bacterium]
MDHDLFLHLCGLARLRLDEREAADFERKFNSMLKMVDSLNQWEPQDSKLAGIDGGLQLRPDKVVEYVWPEGTVHDYRVPTIIDFEGDG